MIHSNAETRISALSLCLIVEPNAHRAAQREGDDTIYAEEGIKKSESLGL